MSDEPILADATALDPHFAETERETRILSGLAELAFKLAEHAANLALTSTEAEEVEAFTVGFERASRAAAKSLAMAKMLREDQLARVIAAREERREQAARREAKAVEVLRRDGEARREESADIFHGLLARSITERGLCRREIDELENDLDAWRSDSRDNVALGQTPLIEIVASLCQDFDVIPKAEWFEDEDLASETLAAYAALPPLRQEPPPLPRPGDDSWIMQPDPFRRTG